MNCPDPGAYLKEYTTNAHQTTEALLLGSAVRTNSVTEPQYRNLIQVTRRVWAVAARELPETTGLDELYGQVLALSQALEKDARLLQLPTQAGKGTTAFPPVTGAAEELGVYYVLLGSTLGGKMIARHLSQCPGLKDIPEFHFYQACGALPGGNWRAFQRKLWEGITTRSELTRCANTAKSIFQLYARWYPGERA